MLPNFPAQVPEGLAPKNRTVEMNDTLYQYLVAHSVRETDLLTRLRKETAQYHMSRMQLSPEVGQFLALLVKLMSPKKLLEIGVFTGYSTLSIAQAMNKDAKLIALEKKQMWLDIANRYIDEAGLCDQVQTICGKALESLQPFVEFESESFDFIFIDADKANLIEYYHQCKQLLRKGGCMAIDNTLWWGNVANTSFTDKDTNIVRQLNTLVHQDDTVDVSLLSIGDGLTLVRKK
ncbi:O-methyltransferase [Marinomonas algicola]|jgi:caffeoyl-CoA O-methyltransferase|uniref:O-methyltransferase n=1 Tax=Marinomonas algicola TaxID=2773454 RepID=UPI00174B739B|nr:class I SAM-dependent methyltransferase [Marinomonas algicola]